MKKRIAILFMAVLLAVTAAPAACASVGEGVQSPYIDVAEHQWYYPYVMELSSQGVIDGYGDGTFRPKESVTWGQAFKLLLLSTGAQEPEPVEGEHWAYPYIELALDEQLVYSFNERYLDAVPTRLEVARMTARALDLTDISGESPYADCVDGYVVELYEKGIMEGVVGADGVRRFLPSQPIDRKEMAAIVWRVRNTDVTQGMFRYSNYWLDVLEDVPASPFTREQFSRGADGRVSYSGGWFAHGIDVSGHKRDIDWQAVAADGIDFAIIRAGNRFYGKNGSGAVARDSYFDRNMQGAIDAGIPVGAYFFSNAITIEEALEEADLLLSMLEPYREHVTYPVVCDWEFLGGKESRAYGVDARTITACIAAFCNRVEEAGYTPMVYFNDYCGYIKMDLSKLTQYQFWYARYASAPESIYEFQMWQYSSSGKVAGISSDVDMNICFVPYPMEQDPEQPVQPSAEPSVEPSPEPSIEPSAKPSEEPGASQPPEQVGEPAPEPSQTPDEPGPVRPSAVPM